MTIPNVLTIAGTDPSGGAGIQADLKTFSALGAYGMSAITAVVAQNTCGVRGVVALEPGFVADQIDAVFDDVRVDAVKIGMVANAGIIRAVADRLRAHGARNVVFDPVMVAKSGDPLLDPEAVAALRAELVPLASVITPNLPEAAVLLDRADGWTADDMAAALPALRAMGPQWVLLKGGHLAGSTESTDLLAGPEGVQRFSAPRIATTNDHGTGCTLSAAIAALLPGMPMAQAVGRAKTYLQGALAAADRLDVGRGHGPLHHFHEIWR
ncbi:MAG: bifunctional hydroxymethylpyrimidine kinase/phosphomethylpyrimidine kinase [Pseudodonghicola sp.]